MTEKRFMVDDAGELIDLRNHKFLDWGDDVCELLNQFVNENEELKSKYSEQCIQLDFLKDENQHMRNLVNENNQLKKELQRMYDVATLNKAIEVLENKYDKMLSDGSDEVKDAMRHTVLRCIEDLDELKDDITAR